MFTCLRCDLFLTPVRIRFFSQVLVPVERLAVLVLGGGHPNLHVVTKEADLL